MQEVVRDHVLDDDIATGHGILEREPGSTVDLRRPKLLARHLVSPLTEGALGVLHNVALVHECDRPLVPLDAVLDRLAHQALRAFARYRLDADSGAGGETDLGHTEFLLQEVNKLLYFLRSRWVLDASVNVFGVLSEDGHVDQIRVFHRRLHAREIAYRAHTGEKVELLPDRHVKRADTAAGRGRQRALDGNDIATKCVQRFVGHPGVPAVHLARALSGEDGHPANLPSVAVGHLHRSLDNVQHYRRHVAADAIAFDVGDDWEVGHIDRVVPIDRDRLAVFGYVDMIVMHGLSAGNTGGF